MSDIAVVTCTYKRPENLRRTLDQLIGQEFKEFDVHLINNNPAIANVVDMGVANSDGMYISVQHNERNHGAYARIEKMVELRDEYEWFMTIDDDMVHGPGLVGGWASQRTPNVIFGYQGWRFLGDYWDREKTSVGEPCSYLWGGNMFIPAAVVADDGILDLDEEYWNCEDIWLAYYANHVLGIEPRMGVSDAYVKEDGKDTYLLQRDTKPKLLNELRARGWQV